MQGGQQRFLMDYAGLTRFMETKWKHRLKMGKWLKIPLLQVPEIVMEDWSGRADLNGRPPAPKAGALTRLRYAPMFLFIKSLCN